MKLIFMLLSCAAMLTAYCQPPDPSKIAPFDYQRDFKSILERTKNRYDTLSYVKLLTRFQRNDSTLTKAETLALMIGYTENNFFKPYADMQTEKDIIKLNDDGFYRDALDESKKYLQTHPLSLSTLKERSYAYHQLRKKDSARYFMDLADKIMEAMIYSGKGKTPETAFFSLGLADGDYFIPNVGLTVWSRKTAKDRKGNFLYIVDAVSLEDVHTTYYFNIQHAKSKMDREENPDPEQKPKPMTPKKGKGWIQPQVKQEPIADSLTNATQSWLDTPKSAPKETSPLPPAGDSLKVSTTPAAEVIKSN